MPAPRNPESLSIRSVIAIGLALLVAVVGGHWQQSSADGVALTGKLQTKPPEGDDPVSKLGLLSDMRAADPRLSEVFFSDFLAGQAALPSRRGAPYEMIAQSGRPVLSLVMDPRDLRGPRGIIDNPGWRGPESERLGVLSVFRDGRLVHETGVAVRMHGGARRRETDLLGLRLYARGAGPDAHFPPGVLLPAHVAPLKRVVLRLDLDFNEVLAYDVANRIGAPVPAHDWGVLYVNTEPAGLFLITEHLTKSVWQSRYLPHSDYSFYVYKNLNAGRTARDYEDLERAVRDFRQRMTLDRARKIIDVDGMLRQILLVVYAGITDWRQGVALKDRRDPQAVWQFVAYDFDHAFKDGRGDKLAQAKGDDSDPRDTWRQEGLEVVTAGLKYWKDDRIEWPILDPRTVLMRRLLVEDPDFPAYFARLAQDMLNHRVTEAYMAARAESYLRLTRLHHDIHGIPDPRRTESMPGFVAQRGEFLFGELARLLGFKGPHRVTVAAGPVARLSIDGTAYGAPYNGRYFEGFRLSVASPEGARVPRGYRINGAEVAGARLELDVAEPLDIVPLY